MNIITLTIARGITIDRSAVLSARPSNAKIVEYPMIIIPSTSVI